MKVAAGDYRMAIETEANPYPCPVCQRPCKAVFLAEGYTRRQLPFIEQTLKPLPLQFRKLLLAKEQTVHHRGREYVLHSRRL